MRRHRLRVTTLTSREFNQDTAGAKKAAANGPVIITDRGQPAHVLITYERFQELTGAHSDIVSLLGMADGAEIDFAAPKLRNITKPAKLD
jgi:prevent-host-death family protein